MSTHIFLHQQGKHIFSKYSSLSRNVNSHPKSLLSVWRFRLVKLQTGEASEELDSSVDFAFGSVFHTWVSKEWSPCPTFYSLTDSTAVTALLQISKGLFTPILKLYEL